MSDSRAKEIETSNAIYGFFGKYRFLSNFHLCDILMPDGFTYPSSENAYMAMKTTDMGVRLALSACTPKEARKIGINPNKIKLDRHWEEMKLGIMEDILRVKFNLPGLKPMLTATDPKYLEETNWWGDKYWGVCENEGENHLGKILMKIRQDLVA